MAWQDRRYDEPRSDNAFKRALRRIFIEGDSFFSWAFPLFTFSGVRVRIHLLFVIVVLAELLSSFRHDAMGIAYTAMGIAWLFVLVLLHEFGHVFACRAVKGEASEILMWPLGGLAMCLPPRHWRAHLVTTVGGPAVNAVLVPVLGLVVVAAGLEWQSLVFNPLSPRTALAVAAPASYWQVAAWWGYYINLILLCFNVLLPMFPLDGGRIMQELLWSRLGYRSSMVISTNVGLVAAVVLGVLALTLETPRLLGVAIFAGFVCFDERRRLRFSETADDDGPYAAARWTPDDAAAERREIQRQERTRKAEERRQAEVDRILAKIAAAGMGALSRRERAILRGETNRKRRGG